MLKMPKCQNIKISKSSRGFTLIELLVAISLFSVVIIIAVGALLNLARAADRSHAIMTAIHNLDFAVEQMSRTLRVGGSYFCSNAVHPIQSQTKDCTWKQGKMGLSFTDKDGRRIVYRLNVARGALDRENLSEVPHRLFSITAPEIFIESVTFNVFGSSILDSTQPRVMIRIKGRTIIPGMRDEDQVPFDLQTTISQRDPDF
ncbi:MAG TPA: prepilin-type N-terminal cleavage/methylation domain-containing protein [Candidatus Paceibacterota bacterium]